ncbi:MAG: transglutaminase-like domain-containing protein, partial [Bacteroidota bacterium]
FIEKARNDPEEVGKWIKANITIDKNANYGRAPLTPRGVYDLKVSDPHSRDILFVAICRSFGIPARIETATAIPQYMNKGKWSDAYFDKKAEQGKERATLVIQNDQKNSVKPEYYTHFTIERMNEGFYRSLDYETDPVMRQFPASVEIIPGNYLVVTGNRITGGTVMATLSFLNLEAGQNKEIILSLRKDMTPTMVYGIIKNVRRFFATGNISDLPITFRNGGILAWIEPDKEPSRHFIADLIAGKQSFEKKNIPILLLFKHERERTAFLLKNRKELPKQVIGSIAGSNSLMDFSLEMGKEYGSVLPLITFINERKEVIYLSEGYKIGVGNDLLKIK